MDYIKDYNIIDTDEKQKEFQLIQTIKYTQQDLIKAHSNFEYADEELIDFYAYQIKALQSKLDYLTRLAKIKNIQDKKAM